MTVWSLFIYQKPSTFFVGISNVGKQDGKFKKKSRNFVTYGPENYVN